MYTEPIRKGLVLPIEKLGNKIFTQKYNPFYYHGALPNVFIWSLFISGLLLFAYYVPTLAKAYDSVRYITFDLPAGNAIRSIHRYAADGMMLFVLIHMIRVWFTDRFREYRILPWVTGVVLLLLTYLVGLTGYLMIWDEEAVLLTNMTLNMLKVLPVIGEPLAWAMIGGDIVSDYTLTRLLFLHLAIPLLLMFFLWMHYKRITRPVATPPLALIIAIFGGVVAVAGLFPVKLDEPYTPEGAAQKKTSEVLPAKVPARKLSLVIPQDRPTRRP